MGNRLLQGLLLDEASLRGREGPQGHGFTMVHTITGLMSLESFISLGSCAFCTALA